MSPFYESGKRAVRKCMMRVPSGQSDTWNVSKDYWRKGRGIREHTSGRENSTLRDPEMGRSLIVLRNQKKGHISRGQRAGWMIKGRLRSCRASLVSKDPGFESLTLKASRKGWSDSHVNSCSGINVEDRLEWHCHWNLVWCRKCAVIFPPVP